MARTAMSPDSEAAEAALLARAAAAEAALLSLERGVVVVVGGRATPDAAAAAAVEAAAAALAQADGALEDLYKAALPPHLRDALEEADAAAAEASEAAGALFGAARAPLQERARRGALGQRAAAAAAALSAEASSREPSAARLAHLRRLRDATEAALRRVEAEFVAPSSPAGIVETEGKGDTAAAATAAASAAAVAAALGETAAPEALALPSADVSPPPLSRRSSSSSSSSSSASPPVSYPPGTLRLVAGAAAIPHPGKAATGGEDAFFVLGSRSSSPAPASSAAAPSSNFDNAEGLGAAGVADGVGGWAAEGVDAALFARRLMQGAAASLLEQQRQASSCSAFSASSSSSLSSSVPVPCVRAALKAAHAATVGVAGSSTAVVAAARPGGELAVAVLGDSGFRLLRAGKIALSSDPQQHSFNMPFQLSAPPPPSEGEPGSSYLGDLPEAADLYEVEARSGDLLLLATDGILDNLWPEDIEAVVAEALEDFVVEGGEGGLAAAVPPSRAAEAASAAAAALAAAAASNGASTSFRSPWVVGAAREGLLPLWASLRPRGGKLDDCTVVVAFLVDAEE